MEATLTTLRIQANKTVELVGLFGGEKTLKNKVQDILVGRTQAPHLSILSIDNLSATKNIIIEVQDETGAIKEISLPEDIYGGLIRYLQSSPDILRASDCLGFIVEVLGGKRGERMVDAGDYSYNGIELIKDIEKLNPGDVISMSDGTEEGWKNYSFHYALYIGGGFFLQKLGKPGVLTVTTLEQMKKLYPKLTFIVKLLLKRKPK